MGSVNRDLISRPDIRKFKLSRHRGCVRCVFPPRRRSSRFLALHLGLGDRELRGRRELRSILFSLLSRLRSMTSNCIQLDDEDDGAKNVEEIEEEIEETPEDDGLREDTENEIDEANEEELVQDDDLDLKTPEGTKAENVAALLR